jgi:hypothetical protein
MLRLNSGRKKESEDEVGCKEDGGRGRGEGFIGEMDAADSRKTGALKRNGSIQIVNC